MSPGARSEAALVAGGLSAGALVVLTLIPVAAGQLVPAPLALGGLIAVGGYVTLAVLLVVAAAARGPRRLVSARLAAATLWCVCGLALVASLAAVAAGAQSLNLDHVVAAQHNTGLFAVSQPAAASIWVVAVALAGQPPALAAALGPPTRARLVAELLAGTALAALGATLFLGGSFAVGGLPGPLWLAAMTLVVGALVLAMRRWLSGLTAGTRLALSWVAALVGLVNLAVTLVVVTQ